MDLPQQALSHDPHTKPSSSITGSLANVVNPLALVRSTPESITVAPPVQYPTVPQLPSLVPGAADSPANPPRVIPPIEVRTFVSPHISAIVSAPRQASQRPQTKDELNPRSMLSYFDRSQEDLSLAGLTDESWMFDPNEAVPEEKNDEPEDILAPFKLPERIGPAKRKKRRTEEELKEIEELLTDLEPMDSKKARKMKRGPTYVIPPRYDKWQHIGHGYLVIPDLQPLDGPATYTDFLFQGFLMVLATGGEGNSSGCVRDEQAPLLAASARLEYSMNIDEHGIEQLKLEAKMAKSVSDQPGKTSVEHLAKIRSALMHKLRDYADDHACIYRPPIDIMENHPEDAHFHGFKASEFYFLTYMIRMIELTSRLMPRHVMVISKALHCFIPLILAGSKAESDCHFVGSKVYLNYFHNLFFLLSRLSEYFDELSRLSVKATFGALKGVRPDVSCVFTKELAKIAEDVDYGGCLSWILCVVRDISIAVMLNPVVPTIVQRATSIVKSECSTPSELVKLAYTVEKGKPLYKFRFVIDDSQMLTFRASKVTHDEMVEASSILSLIPCSVSPYYPLLTRTYDPIRDEPLPKSPVACIPENTSFCIDLALDSNASEPAMQLQFKPNSRTTMISLHE